MEMDAELLNKDNGLDKMFEKLNTLYKEDENEAALINLSVMINLSDIRIRLR